MTKTNTPKIVTTFVLIAALIVIGILISANVSRDREINSITNFDECAAAGYPIQESYPERCAVPGGPTFTRQLPSDN